jgi:hypothetical protein
MPDRTTLTAVSAGSPWICPDALGLFSAKVWHTADPHDAQAIVGTLGLGETGEVELTAVVTATLDASLDPDTAHLERKFPAVLSLPDGGFCFCHPDAFNEVSETGGFQLDLAAAGMKGDVRCMHRVGSGHFVMGTDQGECVHVRGQQVDIQRIGSSRLERVTAALNAIHGLGEHLLVVVGDNGAMGCLRHGVWSRVRGPGIHRLQAAFCRSAQEIYVAGDLGQAWRWDGADTWTALELPAQAQEPDRWQLSGLAEYRGEIYLGCESQGLYRLQGDRFVAIPELAEATITHLSANADVLLGVGTRWGDSEGWMVVFDGKTWHTGNLSLPRFEASGDGGLAVVNHQPNPDLCALERGLEHHANGDFESAREAWLEGAEAGDQDCMWKLFDRLLVDGEWEFDEDQFDLILAWARQAAEADPTRAWQLGCYHADCLDDETTAWPLLCRGAESSTFMAYQLGERLADGDGLTQDEAAALVWLERAANAEPACAYRLGHRYWDGRKVTKDRAAATRWWQQAASQGHEAAIKRLAKLKLPPL